MSTHIQTQAPTHTPTQAGPGDTAVSPTPIVTWLALPVAVVGSAGSVYLSVGMNLKACPLCFYQRSFILGVVGVLGVGLLAGMRRSASLSLLALPLAVAGLFVAGFHVHLERAGVLECPRGVGA